MITILIKKNVLGLSLFALMFTHYSSHGQNKSHLDKYIDIALENNVVLQHKNLSIDRAKTALEIAKSYYYPKVEVLIGYQHGSGGRDIYLPLGDLLNGVYSSLNMLTSTNSFPQLENERINFLPYNFYDAKVRTSAPIYNPSIRYNKIIADQQIEMSQYDLDIYKRDLKRDVTIAYFHYLSSQQLITIYEQTKLLALEGQRVNESLLENGKGLPAYLLRSEAEVANIDAEINTATQQANNAKIYFNFLLNRNLNESIYTTFDASQQLAHTMSVIDSDYHTDSREEILALEKSKDIHETILQLRKSNNYPKLSGFVDLGSQAENFAVNEQSTYYLIGLQLDIPIFSGFKVKNEIAQAKIDIQQQELNIINTKNHLEIQVKTSKNNLTTQLQMLKAKESQTTSARSYHRLIERGYKEGANTFIETVDARNQLMLAETAYQIQLYQVFIATAELERTLSL